MSGKTITENYTVELGDSEINCDCTSGPLHIFVPLEVCKSGGVLIRKVDASKNAVTVEWPRY